MNTQTQTPSVKIKFKGIVKFTGKEIDHKECCRLLFNEACNVFPALNQYDIFISTGNVDEAGNEIFIPMVKEIPAAETESKGKEVMTVQEITEEQIRAMNREYNASAWDGIIDRYKKYTGIKFYHAKKQGGYEYDRYYGVYTIPEGITFFNSISYSSGLSSRGFCRVTIDPKGVVRKFLIKDREGNEGYCNNDVANRKILAGNSQKFGAIFTNNL